MDTKKYYDTGIELLRQLITAMLSEPYFLNSDQAFELQRLLGEGYSHISDYIHRHLD